MAWPGIPSGYGKQIHAEFVGSGYEPVYPEFVAWALVVCLQCCDSLIRHQAVSTFMFPITSCVWHSRDLRTQKRLNSQYFKMLTTWSWRGLAFQVDTGNRFMRSLSVQNMNPYTQNLWHRCWGACPLRLRDACCEESVPWLLPLPPPARAESNRQEKSTCLYAK